MTFMLDTNIASHVIKGDIPLIRQRLAAVPMQDVVISSVTEAELRCGVAKRGYPAGLATRVQEFLVRVETLPWTSDVARAYGDMRAACEAEGVSLAPLDMMIAVHAKAAGAILVTRDHTFAYVKNGLQLEDWGR